MKSFIKKIKFRLNIGIALRAILIGLVIAASITLVWGLTYLLRGYAVHASLVYSVGTAIAVVSGLVYWFIRKKNIHQSAEYADHFFELKDTVASAFEFQESRRQGAIYDLQKKQAAKKMQHLSTKSIPLPLSKKLLACAIIGVVAAGSLALAPPSERVRKALVEKEQTSKGTNELNTLLEEEVEELIKSLSDDEKELVDPDAIRQWVKELKETDNKREALRDIARVEQKIQKVIDSLKNRENEEMLKKAGLSMLKAQDSTTREIGKNLANKEFKEAANQMEQLKFQEKATESENSGQTDKNNKDKKEINSKKSLSEQQKKLAKLRELTKRLGQAAKQSKNQKQFFKPESNQKSIEKFTESLAKAGIQKAPKNLTLEDLKQYPEGVLNQLPADLLNQLPSNLLNQLPPALLDQFLEMLEQNAQNLQGQMENMNLEMMEGNPLSEEELQDLLNNMQNMDQALAALQKMLQNMGAMKQMSGRLQGLKAVLAQGLTPGNQPLPGKEKGGKQAGIGSDNSSRNQKDKLENNKQLSKIIGQKGLGPVKSSIEEAESGTGTSGRKGTIKRRDYERQMSSFIERDDVSEEMKKAVKQYFQDIHQVDTSK